jgi:endonuclease G
VIGGVIWGNKKNDDDYFVKSHAIRGPDAYLKVIIRGT